MENVKDVPAIRRFTLLQRRVIHGEKPEYGTKCQNIGQNKFAKLIPGYLLCHILYRYTTYCLFTTFFFNVHRSNMMTVVGEGFSIRGGI